MYTSPPPWRATRNGALHGGAAPDDPRPRRRTGYGDRRTVQASRRRHGPHHSSSSSALRCASSSRASIIRESGFAIDVGDFNAWGQRLASVGPGEFYEDGFFADYPPGYLYVLWLLGEIGSALAPALGSDITGGLVKIPGGLADVGVAAMLFVIARRWAGELLDRTTSLDQPVQLRARGCDALPVQPGHDLRLGGVGPDRRGRHAASCSLTIYALGRGWTEAAAVGAVVAMLVKFQFAFLIPVVPSSASSATCSVGRPIRHTRGSRTSCEL